MELDRSRDYGGVAKGSSLPNERIEAIRRVLKGEKIGPVGDRFESVASRHHGHVEAVRTAMAPGTLDTCPTPKQRQALDLIAAITV